MRRRLATALICMLPVTAALACGPDFPQRLLDDRKASLFGLPEGTFYFEAAHLLPKPDDNLRAVESSPFDDADKTSSQAEAQGLTADELSKVNAMRAASGEDAAAAAGAGLAPELLEYTLGAIAFKQGQHALAIAHFQKVLAIPPAERSRRGLAALYMLGRAKNASGDTPGAAAAFATVRERRLAGVADPQGLAVASFGEQARIDLHQGAVVAAIKLYADQATHGSSSGAVSLLFVARSLLAHRALLDKAIDDPLTQRLLAGYFFTRSNELSQNWPLAGTRSDGDASPASGDSVAQTSASGMNVDAFLAIVEQHGLNRIDGADRLAAGAYNAGRYALANKLSARSDTALAAWVRAKLALRAGDKVGAQSEYAKAAQGFPLDEGWGSDPLEDAVQSPRCRVESERGILALGRDDYIEAMARLYAGASEYWPDAAYVAERVLTIDELKAFVDHNVPTSKVGPKKGESQTTPAAQLRDLLARRLMRAGRREEALAYFTDPAIRKKAQELIDAHRDDRAWLSVERSAALFKQAKITRIDGMELLGTELAPDNAEWGGGFPAQDQPSTASGPFVGKLEAQRVIASVVHPDARFHYRYVAANLAERAAALVPERSQAYAAMMCHATGWMLDTDSASADRIYHRYLHHGAHVKWAGNFGRSCPEPDFKSAKWLPLRQDWWQTRHWAKHRWPWVLVVLGVVVVLFALFRRRRPALESFDGQ
jgi:cellulose synthase operon protein C